MTTADLLGAWRDATKAAELAQRLAALAEEAADQAQEGLVATDEIVSLAESAAAASEQAAQTARQAAERARRLSETRMTRREDADATLVAALEFESEARDRYHDAERQAQRRHMDGAGVDIAARHP